MCTDPLNQPNLRDSEPQRHGVSREPDDHTTAKDELRDKMLDKTLADSFPTSDPPSSIPDPSEDDTFPE